MILNYIYDSIYGLLLLSSIPISILVIDYIIEFLRNRKNKFDFNKLNSLEILLYIFLLIFYILFIQQTMNYLLITPQIKSALNSLIGPITSMSSVYLASSIKHLIQFY